MKSVKVDCATISVLDKDLYHTVYKPDCLINAVHLERIREAYSTLKGTDDLSDLRLLVEFKGDIDISKDIGERYIGTRIRTKVGEALVSDNPRTIEYLKGASVIMNGEHPIRVFSNVNEAKEWLNEL